ncbi:MAG: hypothetical protein Q8O05_06670 [Chloroflexota bacterium]|nr:hypothetical protein [Chloroflexota bacterium]
MADEGLWAFADRSSTRIPAPVIVGPLLGLLYFFAVPFAVIIAFLVAGGSWARRRVMRARIIK